MSHFYRQYSRISLSGDIVGCTAPGTNTNSSSVIAAYWPGTGSVLDTVSCTTKRVGVVQYFILHRIEFVNQESGTSVNSEFEADKLDHVFCFTHWKKEHPRANWFGISAIICDDCFEIPDACCFLPVQRIYNKCAHVKLNVQFDSSYEDSVFIACPTPIKY